MNNIITLRKKPIPDPQWAYDNTTLKEHRLLTRGEKPVGPVKIHTDSFVEAGDLVYLLRNSNDYLEGPIQQKVNLLGGSEWRKGELFVGTNPTSTTNGAVAVGFGDYIDGATSLGVCITYTTHSPTSKQALLGSWYASNYSLNIIHLATNKVQVIVPESLTSNLTKTGRISEVLSGNIHSAVINWNGGNSWDMWIDGKKHTLTDLDTDNVTDVHAPPSGDLFFGRRESGDALSLDGSIKDVIIHKNGVFTAAQAFAYMRDPYQFLQAV